MTRLSTALIAGLTALTLSLAGAAHAQQGGSYAPRVMVNDRAITNYEVEQRKRFLSVLGAPGNLDEVALEGLIDDRLRLDAGDQIGITLEEEDVAAGMEEFAGRANLSAEQFVQGLASEGIARETFYDFVKSGLVWRNVVRARFGPRAQITEAEIDRALALSSRRGGARVLLSEIILRADTPAFKAEADALANRLSNDITTPGAFAAAARRYSVSGSRGRGGRIDWVDLSTLPPPIAAAVLGLGPGEVSEPLPLPNAVALFQLRAIEELDPQTPDALAVEYARFFMPGASPQAAQKVINRLDTCDDLYGAAKGLPEERLERETKAANEIPESLSLDLARLDDNETALLTQGDTQVVLMLCGRTPVLEDDLDRDAVRARLVNQRMASYADSYLAELRADAIIREP